MKRAHISSPDDFWVQHMGSRDYVLAVLAVDLSECPLARHVQQFRCTLMYWSRSTHLHVGMPESYAAIYCLFVWV